MTDYISREAAFKEFAEFVRGSNNSDFVDAPTWNDAVSLIGSLPAADVVPKTAYGQAVWERDVAISQLQTIGKGLGAKMDDVAPVVHGRWEKVSTPSLLYHKFKCSECGHEFTVAARFNYLPLLPKYCQECGAKMDSSETDEPEINPCRGCSDYDENGGCLSDGRCAGTGENKDG